MSRSDKIRAVTRRVAAAADVGIEADYEQRGTRTEWYLRWHDGPTVETVTALVAQHARGYITPEVEAGLRYGRDVTARALAAAMVQRLLNGEQPEAYEAPRIADTTGFPSGVSDRAWPLADFALARAGIDPQSTWEYEARPALEYLAAARRDGLLVDFWHFSRGKHPECPAGPPQLDLDTPAARAAVDTLYRELQRQLLGRSAHAGDHRARQLAAQAIRRAVPEMLTDRQRVDAAAAVVDGWGLRSLGRAVGLADRTLSKTLGPLDEQVRMLTWLRDNLEEWSGACRAAAAAVHRDVLYVMPADDQHDLTALRAIGRDDLALLDTVPAARRVIATPRLWGTSTRESLTALSVLLEQLDRAEPPTSRERHSRPGVPRSAKHRSM